MKPKSRQLLVEKASSMQPARGTTDAAQRIVVTLAHDAKTFRIAIGKKKITKQKKTGFEA
jgi:hypothetical protein